MKTLGLSLWFFFFFPVLTVAQQVFIRPNFSQKSHETLFIDRIEITSQYTIITLTVVNKRTEGGWFCADNNIYIKNSNGTQRYQLVKSENIPVCPEAHHFTRVGEELSFVLYFPPIPSDFTYIDIVEDCSNSCFSFNEVILNNELNEKVSLFEKGMEYYAHNKPQDALSCFKTITADITDPDLPLFGYAYVFIYKIYTENGQMIEAEKYRLMLQNSNIRNKAKFLQDINNLNP